MIPRHLLPFRLSEALSLALAAGPAPSVADVENAYAEALGATGVILFPSARAAIHVVLRAVCGPHAPVVCPAYTCEVVHEALDLLRARTHYLDTAPDSFLISAADIGRALEPDSAVILSDLYGIQYDQASIDEVCPGGKRLRIFDLAMSIPSPQRIGELGAKDVAIYSFGWGKPMYAGWGAIACFQDAEFVRQVRRARDLWVGTSWKASRRLHQASVLIQIVMNQRLPHGILETPVVRSLLKVVRGWNHRPPVADGFRYEATSAQPALRFRSVDEERRFSDLPAEWIRPLGNLDRRLAIRNLPLIAEHAELRRSQAQTYCSLLVEPGTFRGPSAQALPQSHFPLRIAAAGRDRFRQRLRRRGIDTSVLFSLPPGVDRRSYPNAALAADEVVTLPMGPSLTPLEVHMIAACAQEAARDAGLG